MKRTYDRQFEKSPNDELVKDSKELMDELYMYFLSYKWLKKYTSKEKIKSFVASNFDYDALVEGYGITYNNACSSIKWAGQALQEKIGPNTLALLNDGYIDEARASFYVHCGALSVSKLFCSDALEYLPEARINWFSLTECVRELKTLKSFSKYRIDKLGKSADLDKMAYLLFVLEGNTDKSNALRPYLISYLQNNLDLNDLLEADSETNKEI